MSNSQSRMNASAIDNCDYDYYGDITGDKLVLCFEEIDVDTRTTDMVCYVMYDQLECEYFICGKRQADYNDFKFFCKSRKHVVRLLKNIMDLKNNVVNHVLYNYKDLYLDENGAEYESIDYYALWENKRTCKEICAYDGVKYSEAKINSLLSVLKHVRY